MTYGLGGELHQLEEALEAGGMAWWVMELPSGAVFFSPNKAKMLGRDPEDFLHYKDFMNIVHPDDHDKAMKAMRDHMEGKKPKYETKYRIQAADGSYKVFYDRGKIVSRKKTGEMTITGVIIDISSLTFDEADLSLLQNQRSSSPS